MAADTSRIALVPSSPELLLALIDGVDRFAELAGGVELAPGLREFYASPDVSPGWVESLRQANGADPWRDGFFVVDRSTSVAVGTAGFKGPPASDGAVEIAYGVAPTYQGRGYATEAANALIDYARDNGQARVIRAHTLPERNASTRVLQKCGFNHVGTVIDPEDGTVWRWERPANVQGA